MSIGLNRTPEFWFNVWIPAFAGQMKKLFCLVSLFLLLRISSASALTFNITYDASVTSLTNAAQVEAAFDTALQPFRDTFTNVVTINLTIYWGPVGPFASGISLGRSHFFLTGKTYAQITNAMLLHRASAEDTNAVANLPAIDPTLGSWFVPIAEARVLGLYPTNDSQLDGEIGFASDKNFTFDPNNRSVAGKFDFFAVAQHELTEVMGRCTFDLTTHYVPYDLFRFTNSGVRSLDLTTTTNAYFSIDNGVTALRSFFTNRSFGDIQDWKSVVGSPDSFDALSQSGHVNPMSTADIIAMDVLGYNGSRLVPPRLYLTNLASGSRLLRFVNSPDASFTVLAATNLMQPLASWAVLGAPTQSPVGQFQFTDTTATNQFRFYMVRSP
jgi:hypothetical protein